MEIFDCNCCFGRCAHPPFRYAPDAAGLLAEMDFCGIDRALVYHAGMRFDSPSVWNERLVEEVKGNPRLFPTWTLLPPQTGELAPVDDLLAFMRARGINALRAFPQEHHYLLNKDTFGELLDACVERRIPLFIKQNVVTLGALLAEFPRLLAVAVNQGPHSIERTLRPLLDKYPGLHVETSSYMVEGLIEEFCERYGPHRLLFGSGFPDNCSGAALLRLAQAEISEEQRHLIAAGNLDRLLSEGEL